LHPNAEGYASCQSRGESIWRLSSHTETKIGKESEKGYDDETASKSKFLSDDGEDEIVMSGGQKQVFLPALI